MTVPYAFGAATTAIPLSQLDSNFNTPITLGNTAIQLGNTVTTLNNMTLANVTISSGNVTITNVTVTTANATTVNTTTLIATTANVTTINATDINVAANVTLNAGTVNGVAYLNGSKVLTSGSVMTFDGTRLGLGGGTNGSRFSVSGAGAVGGFDTGAAADGRIEYAYNGTNIFYTGMDSASLMTLMARSGVSLAFGANGSEQMRLTSTGLGIGTSSPSYKLHVVGTGGFANNGNENLFLVDTANTTRSSLQVSGNTTFFNGNIDTASHGQFQWRSSNAYTERMRITTSGNLTIGGTGDSARLRVEGTTNLTAGLQLFRSGDICSALWSESAALRFGVDSSTGFTERMTLDSSGNLVVGGTSAVYTNANRGNITINGASTALLGLSTGGTGRAYLYTDGSRLDLLNTQNDALTFGTNNTERTRIDSSGNLLVGKTTSDGRLTVQGSTANGSTYTAYLTNSSNTELFGVRTDGLVETGVAANSPYNLTTGSAANVFVDSQGWLYRSTSSLKYKTDVQNAVHGLADVLALRPVTYKGKNANDGETVFGGLIAEEVHAAGLTEFVQYAQDGSPDALAYGNMVSLCIKAIQELKAEFDAYKATHP